MAAPAPILLIVGLGNPGAEYAATRHNAGFWLVDRIAREHGARFGVEGKLAGELCRIRSDGQPCWLFKPMTFMNRSGGPVGRVCGYYQIPPSRMLVAHDDLDLPPGAVRLKQGGGHGGHNGLRDLLACLGDAGFWRLRIGIGHPGDRDRVVDYVLSRPGASDLLAIEGALADAVSVHRQLLAGEMQRVMNHLHGPR